MPLDSSLRKIEDLKPGDHICRIYDSKEEHKAVLLPFLRHGLERGEKILYITDRDGYKIILNCLRDEPSGGAGHGFDVESYLDGGQLSILASDYVYLRGGSFEPDRMIDLLRNEEVRALKEGYSALRITGELSWALRGLADFNLLFEYEAKLNDFFHGSKCLGVCQYERKRFPSTALLNVLRTHPIVIFGKEIVEDINFEPAAKLLGYYLSKDKLRHHLDNLV